MNKQIKVSNNCLEVRSLKVGDKIDFSKGKDTVFFSSRREPEKVVSISDKVLSMAKRVSVRKKGDRIGIYQYKIVDGHIVLNQAFRQTLFRKGQRGYAYLEDYV